MQTSAMKTCFQIAECNFSFAKLCNISVTSKYLNEINFIIGLIILNLPSCFASGMRNFSSVYSPALHGKRQGSICHDEQVAYRPFPLCTCLLCFKNATGFVGQRSLLHRATKLASFANEAYCVF